MGKRSSKGNSRGTGIKKIMCSIAVMCVLLCSSTIAQGIEWQWPWLKAKEQKTKQEQVVKKKNLPLRPKQIGTPTVQALLDKVKANYQKIQDLKANWNFKTWDSEFAKWLGIVGDLITQDEEFLFKAPGKLKWIPPEKVLTVIVKDRTEYSKSIGEWGAPITEESSVGSYKLPWYTLLDPEGLFEFYFRLDEIMTKFDTKVIDNPQPDTWVIEAVPKKSNPEDDYNYPTGAKVELFVDYEKGVIIKINCIDHEWSKEIGKIIITEQNELKNFTLINNIWIPTTLIKIQPPLPKYRPKEVKEEITLSHIQINIGIPDSEFEF
ncbi:MAG: hypothetical protein AB1414_17770 [bacterium]